MIRMFKLEDADYIINSHYKIYNREYQYDLSFRDFIAESVNGFIKRSDSKENIWILEIEGEPKGSISIKKVNDKVAQLGLFLVEPDLRGSGYGKQLLQTAIAFCKEKGYQAVILWTNSELKTARRIYEKNGFQLKETRIRNLSNKELIEEKWELSI
ncbi:GNAT family N-acetyltransferase [Parageobacillus sp. KH3-4]|jgi:GNAT superfamily N-acetyltransferase|uniref:GNAT family N-acetyltransferase n=1 Tax=Parageobacillus sp. KH3-4 TaxID=2916802 RepID=UPI001FCC47BC|nr:GNAT family N-acetyltransferase [Parageobacillus sp. KH3-4]BDG47259.1 GNAT family N-acetyltransferase [Parageobacillus sp. KH3-4]